MTVGDKFGSLTYISESELKVYGRRTGNFKCDCGRLHTTTIRNVAYGRTKSCGCKKYDGLKAHRYTMSSPYSKNRTVNSVMTQLKSTAKAKKLPMTLSKEYVEKLVQSHCFYCNEKFTVPIGLDRIDSSLGYIENNVVPCCSTCNRMKLNLDLSEFITHINKIYFALNKRGELLENPEEDNQQPSQSGNRPEGSTTRNRVLTEDSNIPKSALDID
jgi:hypothetical protein